MYVPNTGLDLPCDNLYNSSTLQSVADALYEQDTSG